MGLKIANFTFTDEYGVTQNAYMTWQGMDVNYGEGGSIRFAIFENADEALRGNKKRTEVMPISFEDMQIMFSTSGVVAFKISDASWDMALTRQFIRTRVIQNDEPVMVYKSLTELNATLTDI